MRAALLLLALFGGWLGAACRPHARPGPGEERVDRADHPALLPRAPAGESIRAAAPAPGALHAFPAVATVAAGTRPPAALVRSRRPADLAGAIFTATRPRAPRAPPPAARG